MHSEDHDPEGLGHLTLHLLPQKHLTQEDLRQIVALEVSRSIREGGTIAEASIS